MAIYDMFDSKEKRESASAEIVDKAGVEPQVEGQESKPFNKRDQFFSATASRLFFLLLLGADLVWAVYAFTLFMITTFLTLATGFKVASFQKASAKSWISVKRSLVCGLALVLALCSPAFGIMVACTYFLMYDKSGIEEVVPASLQDQFKEFFQA